MFPQEERLRNIKPNTYSEEMSVWLQEIKRNKIIKSWRRRRKTLGEKQVWPGFLSSPLRTKSMLNVCYFVTHTQTQKGSDAFLHRLTPIWHLPCARHVLSAEDPPVNPTDKDLCPHDANFPGRRMPSMQHMQYCTC